MAFREGSGGYEMWPTCYQHGVAAISYEEIDATDLSKFPVGEPKDLLQGFSSSQKSSLRAVAHEMAKGDVVYVKQGTGIVGRGTVTGPYKFQMNQNIIDSRGHLWPHQVPVAWESDFSPVPLKLGAELHTVLELDERRVSMLNEAIARARAKGVAGTPPETVLLAWNPKYFPWQDLSEDIRKVQATGRCKGRWSCGSTRSIEVGSRFFLIRLGVEPKGLVGSGRIESSPSEGPHFRDTGRKAIYVGINFDYLQERPVVTLEDLSSPPFSSFRWAIQGSGVHLPDQVAVPLEDLWLQRTGSAVVRLPEEVPPGERFPEGGIHQITVNAYERNPEARRACLSHYGEACVVCGFRFSEAYEGGQRVSLHVHHLVPLQKIRETYVVDPIKDLRPLCPNCHAMAHSRPEVYSLDELRSLVRFTLVMVPDA
jgi:5-methylcytosine-specific restriction protein A